MSSKTYYLTPDATLEHPDEIPLLRYITTAESSAERNDTVRTHRCTEFFFFTGGDGVIKVQDKRYRAAEHNVLVVNANVDHTVVSQLENPLSYILLGVERLSTLEDMGGSVMVRLCSQQTQIRTCLDLMLREAEDHEKGWESVCGNLLQVILQTLTRQQEDCLCETPFRGSSKTGWECEQVRSYIDNHFKENLCLDDLADMAHINKYYLSHVFQKKFGTSPISYLIARRIRESRYMLADTNQPLSQIANTLGFSSLSYFSQSFRRLEGISPLAYRKRYWGTGQKPSTDDGLWCSSTAEKSN